MRKIFSVKKIKGEYGCDPHCSDDTGDEDNCCEFGNDDRYRVGMKISEFLPQIQIQGSALIQRIK